MNKGKIRRLTKNAMLAAAALIIFVVEAQIPALVPIPGVKLGLANIVTVYAMFLCGPVDTLGILLCRIVLGSIFAGQIMSFLYSICGGIFCYLIMLLMRKIVTENQIWVCSVVGAVFHNIGQITAAIFITQTLAIAGYLPVLLISGIISGTFTGLCAQLVVHRMKRIGQNFHK